MVSIMEAIVQNFIASRPKLDMFNKHQNMILWEKQFVFCKKTKRHKYEGMIYSLEVVLVILSYLERIIRVLESLSLTRGKVYIKHVKNIYVEQ